MEVKILSPDPENIVGEIVCKGPNVMLGYYKNHEATAEVIDKDGWLHTGDLGVMDAEGNVTIKGRSKNMLLGYIKFTEAREMLNDYEKQLEDAKQQYEDAKQMAMENSDVAKMLDIDTDVYKRQARRCGRPSEQRSHSTGPPGW